MQENKKLPKFNDIPQITASKYRVNISWTYIKYWLKEEQVNMDPDYQRDYVWTKTQKEQYIEWILKNGISGKDIFFNHPGWFGNWDGQMEIVDGKQRISAVLSFLNNEIKAYGYYLNQYTDRLNTLTCSFTVHILDLKSRKEVMQWYIDMNSGGTIHTNEDIEKVKMLINKPH